MANRVIGIEYADDRIKIVEVSFARRLKVFNFAVVDNRNVDPLRRAEQLNHTLQIRGFEARDAVMATSGVNVEHRLLTLPPLSGREMHFVMQRESKKIAPSGMNETLWSYDILKAKEELGIKKNQILLVTAERPLVDNAQAFLSQTKLKLQQVTTIPEAVLTLYRQAGAWKKDAVRTMVHFAGNLVHIIFAQDGVLLLSREIHFDSTMAHDEQVVRLVSELKRSILYFRQNFPQAQLEQVVFSGDNDALGALATRSSEELGITGSIARFEEQLDTSSFRGNWDEFRFHLPSLTAALGAAWRKSPGTTGINLLPGKTQAKQVGVNPTKIARMACSAAVALTLLTGVHYLREKGKVDAVLQEVAQRAAIVDPQLQQLQQHEARRLAIQERSAFLERIAPTVDWTEVLRGLSFVIPESAVFDEILVERKDTPVMIIRGRLLAATAGEANTDFNRFFNDVRGLPFFKDVTMPKPLSVSYEDTATSTPVSMRQLRSKVSFEIQCQLP